jgi:hypothetical protein
MESEVEGNEGDIEPTEKAHRALWDEIAEFLQSQYAAVDVQDVVADFDDLLGVCEDPRPRTKSKTKQCRTGVVYARKTNRPVGGSSKGDFCASSKGDRF